VVPRPGPGPGTTNALGDGMSKTIAAMVLSVGLSACMDDPQTDADPQADNAGETQTPVADDHQEPAALGSDLLQNPDENPETDFPATLITCGVNRAENSAGQSHKDARPKNSQCRPLAG